jgi:hypothetical protein
MAEENTDVSTGTAVEATESVTDSAPVVDTATPENATPEVAKTEEAGVDWDTPFPEFPVEEEVKEATPAVEKEGDKSPAPESGEEKAKPEEEKEDDDEPEIALADIDPSKPPKLSRRQREKAVADIIDPFRDPSVPTEDVFNRLYALDPDRATSLVNTAVEKSVSSFPDEWLSQILGETVTVADVKAKLSTPTQAQAESDTFSEIEKSLTETYGDAWKDASRDDELLSEDKAFVQAIRAYRSDEAAKNQQLSDSEKKIAELEQKLNTELGSIKDAQTQQIQQDTESLYEQSVGEYRGDLEKKSLAKVFEDAGLNPSENDTPDVKAIKEFVTARFDFNKSGDFDRFVGTEFSDREKAQTIIARVDQNFKDAAKAEAEAKRATGDQAAQLRTQAKALRNKAQMEKATLTVLHRTAAQEFLGKALAPVMNVLKQNADLRRQLSQTRPELVNGAAAAAGDGWKERLQKSDDPWESKEGWGELAAGR